MNSLLKLANILSLLNKHEKVVGFGCFVRQLSNKLSAYIIQMYTRSTAELKTRNSQWSMPPYSYILSLIHSLTHSKIHTLRECVCICVSVHLMTD